MSLTNLRSSNRLMESANREPAAAGEDNSFPTCEDNSSPTCDVFLYVRPICGKLGKPPVNAKHWVLYFEWNWGYKYHFEANNVDEILTPSEGVGKPEEVLRGPEDNEDMKFKVQMLKEKLCVLPDAVKAKAKINTFTGNVYNLRNKNCQIWVTELGRLLGIDLPLDQAAKADGLATSLLGGAAIGSGLVVKSLISSRKKRKLDQ